MLRKKYTPCPSFGEGWNPAMEECQGCRTLSEKVPYKDEYDRCFSACVKAGLVDASLWPRDANRMQKRETEKVVGHPPRQLSLHSRDGKGWHGKVTQRQILAKMLLEGSWTDRREILAKFHSLAPDRSLNRFRVWLSQVLPIMYDVGAIMEDRENKKLRLNPYLVTAVKRREAALFGAKKAKKLKQIAKDHLEELHEQGQNADNGDDRAAAPTE